MKNQGLTLTSLIEKKMNKWVKLHRKRPSFVIANLQVAHVIMKKNFNICDAIVQSQMDNLIGDYPLIHPFILSSNRSQSGPSLPFSAFNICIQSCTALLNIYVAYVT